MVADLAKVGAVFACPAIGRFCGIDKVQDPLTNGIALKADLSGDNTLLGGGTVDRAICGGGELHAVLFVKNYAINGIGKCAVTHTIEDNVPYGNLPEERFSLCLGADDARKPQDLITSVITAPCGDAAATARDGKATKGIAPFDTCSKRAIQLQDRGIHRAVFHKNRLIVVKISAIGNDIAAFIGAGKRQGACSDSECARIRAVCNRSRRIKIRGEFSDPHIRGIIFYLNAPRKRRTVYGNIHR